MRGHLSTTYKGTVRAEYFILRVVFHFGEILPCDRAKKFTCVNEIEAMYERPKGSTLTYTRDLLYILFIYLRARTEIQTFREDFHCHVIFMCVCKIYARKRNILYARLRINEKEILVETIRNDDF